MNIFNKKIKKKHIQGFDYKIAELLKNEFPQIKKALSFSHDMYINATSAPNEISILKSYYKKQFEKLKKNHKTHYLLNGILVYHRKTGVFKPIILKYISDSLGSIRIENPEYFHKNFDLSKIQKGAIKLEHLSIGNPDQKTAEKALKSLNKEQIELLELDDAFEIEFEEKLFYTILDLENGNYIAVDQQGKVYRLSHDHKERVKLIVDKPTDFFKIYKGQKRELEEIIL